MSIQNMVSRLQAMDIDDDVIQITFRKHPLHGSRLDVQLTWERFLELYPEHEIRHATGTDYDFMLAEHKIGDCTILSVVG